MLLERQLPFVNDLNSFFYNNSHLGLWAILGLMTLLTVIAFIAKMNMREMAGRLYKHSGRTTLYIIIAAFLFLWLLDILYEISTWYARPGQETVLSGVIRNLGRTISFVVFFSVVLLLFWSIKSLVAARKASFKTRMMWSLRLVLRFHPVFHRFLWRRDQRLSRSADYPAGNFVRGALRLRH